MRKIFLYFVLIGLLGGCHRTYHPELPNFEPPPAWKESFPNHEAFVEKNHFWEFFEDPVLNGLEEEAIAGNFDLHMAASRILEARSGVTKEHAGCLPKIDADTSLMKDETLLNPPSFGSPTHQLERVQQKQYNLLTHLSYELDLWGKIKAKETSAHHRLQAAQWEYEFIYQTVVAGIATHYFTLRALEAEILFLKQAITTWKETVEINESRVQAGVDPEIELSRAQLELALEESELEEAERQYAIYEHALATLLGKSASNWSLSPGKMPVQVPPLPNVLPSEVLMRRADIQQKWALLTAERSDVDVALRDYFPSFSLTTSAGLASPLLTNFFQWQARYWSYAMQGIQHLFDGGTRKANVLKAKARFSESFASYQKSVNLAFQDVEDALVTLHHLRLQGITQDQAVSSANHTFCLAKEQFDCGLISYLLVADSERTRLQMERKAIALKGKQILAWIQLMKALGIQQNSK